GTASGASRISCGRSRYSKIRSNSASEDCTSVETCSIEPIGKNSRDWRVVKPTSIPAAITSDPAFELTQPERGIGRDRGGDAGRLHHPPVSAVLPDRLDAAGLHRGAVLAGAVRSDLRIPGPPARDPGRAGRRADPRRVRPRAAAGRALPLRRAPRGHPGLTGCAAAEG